MAKPRRSRLRTSRIAPPGQPPRVALIPLRRRQLSQRVSIQTICVRKQRVWRVEAIAFVRLASVRRMSTNIPTDSGLSRREFIFLAAAASVSCAAARTKGLAPSNSPPVVRAPALGQSWSYVKHDSFTGALVDTETNRVSAIGKSVEIELHSEKTGDKPMTYPSWGDGWWQEYMATDTTIARAPTEVQKPWGMIVVDPHWS